ncbi:MAG: threonine synthase [Clostridia bacterium]|nr:threonine synthase [Clostridia bacterium]
MRFLSTRGNSVAKNAAMAITKGLADDGGLFVPENFPCVTGELKSMLKMDYAERAAFIIGKYLEEYDQKELYSACKKAYSEFEEGDAAPVVKIDDNLFVLELFHGPTLAFKDIALTLLPYLLRKGASICGVKETILILVATSGDTGKAALEGFKDKEGVKICVFYPSEGVSDMQKLQMCTQSGENVNVVGVSGNFDDCQTAVKKVFTSVEENAKLKAENVILSSANSINFGRLVPQVAYYFSAYCDLVNAGEISLGDTVDFTVPTGNFGNILAGYYAKKMGLPIGKLVCASNSNNVLTEFFLSGTYDVNREFFKTMSPSMDILISSNLERLIFELTGRDSALTAARMSDLRKVGKYSLSEAEHDAADKVFFADYCDEEECKEQMRDTFDEFGYLCDPHTAVAFKAAGVYQSTERNNKMVVLSTASPYKFSQNVLKAISGKSVKDPFVAAETLETLSAVPIPTQISQLKSKEKRFIKVIDKADVAKEVYAFAVK